MVVTLHCLRNHDKEKMCGYVENKHVSFEYFYYILFIYLLCACGGCTHACIPVSVYHECACGVELRSPVSVAETYIC